MPRILIDLTGQAFGSLRVIRRAYVHEESGARWECECACGNLVDKRSQKLRNGKTKSCGCQCGLPPPPPRARPQVELDKQGRIKKKPDTKTPRRRAYAAWSNMLQRCNNPTHPAYSKYGAKEITVHERWLSFEVFIEDMGYPLPGHNSLDRFPNRTGNYEPGNARWTTQQRQQRGRSNNRIVNAFGLSYCLADWADILGLRYRRLSKLFYTKRLTIEEIVNRYSLQIPSAPRDLTS